VISEERQRRYGELAVTIGANVQPGQDVVVSALVDHADVARAVVREAYRAGAQHVIVLYNDLHLRRAAIELGPAEEVGWSPPYLLDWVRRWGDERPALISLTGNPDPDLLADLDPALVGRADPREMRTAMMGHFGMRRFNWTAISAPTGGWAKQIFGETDLERLWDAVAAATRLDEPDPVAAWSAHLDRLQGRADVLNTRGFDALHFVGPGTDLTVGLGSHSRWICARHDTEKGIEHVANLPTEEVFATPDWRRTEGVVRSTYPLVTASTRVSDLALRFAEGRIVEVNASAGGEIVRAQLATDAQAAFLGEVALVDDTSAVKQTGLVFCDSLVDENAACHLAYGNSIRIATNADAGATREELLAIGANVSGIHIDFMIGGPEVDVNGLDSDGSATPIIRDDVWQLS
jgi:aminopeptidase